MAIPSVSLGMKRVLVAVLAGCGSPEPPAPPMQPVPTPSTPPPAFHMPVVDDPTNVDTAPDGSIGTPHPLTMQAMAPDGSWLVVCQARVDTDHDGKIAVEQHIHGHLTGDRLAPYLVIGSGAGIAIDELTSWSGDGRWLAVVRDGTLELVDMAKHWRTTLPDADVRLDPDRRGRAASIAANGTRMTYFRHDPDRDRIVVRELPSGNERMFDLDEAPARVEVDDAGRWARLVGLRTDAKLAVSTGPHGCYPRQDLLDDVPPVRWMDLRTGGTIVDRSIVRAVGDRLLRNDDTAGLRFGDDVIADASCHALVRAVSIAPPRVLATCGGAIANRDAEAPVHLLGPGFLAVTTNEVTSRDPFLHRGTPELIANRVWCFNRCVDLVFGSRLDLPPGNVAHAHGDRVLLHDGDRYLDVDLRTGKTLFARTGKYEGADGRLVAIDNDVYDLDSAKRVAGIAEIVVASMPGHVLLAHPAGACQPDPHGMPYACVDGVPNLAAGGAAGLPSGPLHWR